MATMLAMSVAPVADSTPMLDKNNIINEREGESLYQICIKLRRRLSGVPGFQTHLDEMRKWEKDSSVDPVSSLWRCFRNGEPLLTIYNASQPETELKTKTTSDKKLGKEATFLFIKACMHDMNIPPADTFTVTDLFSDTTTGFLRVTRLVNRVLDLLQMSGKIRPISTSDTSENAPENERNSVIKHKSSMTRKDHILKELVDSERHYVHHLQNLQAMKKQLEETSAIAGDSLHSIFLNVDNIIDFAQRFLIRIEQQYEVPDEEQDWGRLFTRYQEQFRQYEPFIANQKRCEATCLREWSKMVAAANTPLMNKMLANPTILGGFLLKPFQRLTKYPLLLKDLEKQLSSEERKDSIRRAIFVVEEVLNRADASIDKESREDAVADLEERIDDWKSLEVQSLGELLLLGSFNVIKESHMLREEKDYHIYLFERILLMCKEVNPSKAKRKGLPMYSPKGKPKLHIKGRIYFVNMHTAAHVQHNGSHCLRIIWTGERGDVADDQFLVKFKSEETMKRWHELIHSQRSTSLLERNAQNASSTRLVSLQNAKLENPYMRRSQDEDQDYSRMSTTTLGADSDYSMSRNASSTSLRQRSTTSSSGSAAVNGSSHRLRGLPAEITGLTQINTRVATQSSANHPPGESYFSPIERDTPLQSASTRSSAQSAYQATYCNATPIHGVHEPSYRNTAPAMGRHDPRTNPYVPGGRPGQRPSLPPGSMHSASNISRMRSASSPDIHPNVQANRKYENVPAVPTIPKGMASSNRAQSNYPNTTLPHRSNPSGSYTNHNRPQMPGHGYTYDPSYATAEPKRQNDIDNRPFSTSTEKTLVNDFVAEAGDMPAQLRAKIKFRDNYVSMIILSDITYRQLIDRIDAKLSKITHYTIASGHIKLKYTDQDGDLVLIDSDEAVSEALLDWQETHEALLTSGLGAEIELFAQCIQ